MFSSRFEKFLEKEIESLKEEVKRLQKSNESLQAALIAKESPIAYQDFVAPKIAVDNEARDQFNKENQFLKRYASAIEGPLFESADEMLESLALAAGAPNMKAVHDNSES